MDRSIGSGVIASGATQCTSRDSWLGVGWHGIEAAVAVGAGLAAGSIALIGFGADSLIESAAGIILLWRFAASRASSEDAEHRAQKLIAVSFYVIAAYVGFEAVRSLLTGERPDASWVGIGGAGRAPGGGPPPRPSGCTSSRVLG
jgi:divalent metal cation (Fe/Co/Zn/Cd) transporter